MVVPVSAPNAPSASPKVRFKKAVQQQEAGQAEVTSLKEKIRKLQSVTESRLQEINENAEQRKVLLQELATLRNEKGVFTEDKIFNSHHYLGMKSSLQAIQLEYKVLQDSLNNKLKLANEARATAQKEIQIMKQGDADVKKSMSQELVQYQMRLEELSKENAALTLKLEAIKNPPSAENKEALQLVSTQQKQLQKLRNDVDALKKEKEQVIEFQSKVQALHAQLTEREGQFKSLSSQYQTLNEYVF